MNLKDSEGKAPMGLRKTSKFHLNLIHNGGGNNEHLGDLHLPHGISKLGVWPPSPLAWFCPKCGVVWARAEIAGTRLIGDYWDHFQVINEPCFAHGRASLAAAPHHHVTENLPTKALQREVMLAAQNPKLYLRIGGLND